MKNIAEEHGLLLILDGSLIGENAYFIKQREAGYADKSISEILTEMMGMSTSSICRAAKAAAPVVA